MINSNVAKWVGAATGLAAVSVVSVGYYQWQQLRVGARAMSMSPIRAGVDIGMEPRAFNPSPEYVRRQKERDKYRGLTYTAIRARRFPDAEKYARTLIGLDKRDLEAWEYLARALDSQGRELEARDAYAELLREDPSRCSSRQNDPDVIMRYAVLCLHTNQRDKGLAAAQKAMDEVNKYKGYIAKKIPSLPLLPLMYLNPPIKQIEATSHLLTGISRVGWEGPEAGLPEFDAIIAMSSDDSLLAAAYYQKYECYGTLRTIESAKADFYRSEAEKAIKQVALHDRNNGFYMGYVQNYLIPSEMKENYGSTPDRTLIQ